MTNSKPRRLITRIISYVEHSSAFHRDDTVMAFAAIKSGHHQTASILLSRFVASYAMAETAAFADWISEKLLRYYHVCEFSEADDYVTSNNGLRQIFLNFPRLSAACGPRVGMYTSTRSHQILIQSADAQLLSFSPFGAMSIEP